MRKVLGLVVVLVLVALASGCSVAAPGGTAGPVSSSPTIAAPAPSPTPSLSADQAAALAALNGYQSTKDKLYADPTKYSTKEIRALLATYAGYNMIQGNAAALKNLQKSGDRFPSGPASVWVQVSDVINNHNERGLEVHITVCHDNSAVHRVDSKGTVLGAPSKTFAVRQFSVRKPGKAWRVFGETASSGECHR